MEERIISTSELDQEQEDTTIRPIRLDEFIGQNVIRESIKIAIEASKKRGEPLDHILFSGPPGLGKTTLAYIIANEMGVSIKSTSGPILEKPGDLAAILTSLKRGDVLFIDEIHRMNSIIEEVLYPAMEDLEIDVMIGEGASARSIKLNLEHFTLIGATTKIGLLSSPLRDRFGITFRLNHYTIDELVEVVHRSASILRIPITRDGTIEIAKRGRGTPRIVNRLLRRARDFAVVRADGTINRDVADDALAMLGIDKLGLDELDRRILTVIADDFEGGPVGLKTIAISVGEEVRTIEDVYEPYLIQVGFIQRTPQGRKTTLAGKEHLIQ
ncbi:MAG: Holliday junction branch migration DNA helicase RuvB [Methanosarcinales archaeon]|nr:Holliday junction branch migration DNA helicase RuvB [Methanosarcinales archaeon]MCD4767439.1 Holliday junction branch migration DNA helicase RuvB [Methanosarcinales archaeon]